MKEKIILGTVQLGLAYGINNTTGKPSQTEASDILDFAFDNKIEMLDTADVYGDALQVIGNHHLETGRVFRIINKFKTGKESLSSKLDASLKLLNSSSLYCYMYHQYSDYHIPEVRNELRQLKRDKLVEKIGISVYGIEELKGVMNDPEIEVIQLPVNVLDLNSEKKELLHKAKESGKEIHARSIYLQGLILKNTASFTGNLVTLKPYIENISTISSLHGMDVKMSALNFVIHQSFIDKVVVGIDSVDQLRENLALINPVFDASLFANIKIKKNDVVLLNPVNWRP